MNKITLLALARALIFLFISLSLSGVVVAQVVEKIRPDSMGRWLVGDFEIRIHIDCGISRSELWPKKNCGEPSIVIARNFDKEQGSLSGTVHYFKLIAESVELGDKWMFDGNEDPNRRVPWADMAFGSVRSVELFRLLMFKDNLKIKFLTRANEGGISSKVIVLADFKSYADKQIADINFSYDQQEGEARMKSVMAVIFIVILLTIIFLFVRYVFKTTRGKVIAVAENIEKRRVSRVAEDEAIRVVVRESVQKIDNHVLHTLRNQIKIALDAGDTKTAQELLRVLSRLEAE